jgi:flagellar P-ring protein precursor FlgI
MTRILRTLAVRLLHVALCMLTLVGTVGAQEAGGARLKDVVSLQGASATPLVGYGLVVGLNKTGDRRQTIFSGQIKIENVAAVLVTTEIGPYNQTGARLDITASSIGDARSLQGGTLLPTPLRGPDGAIVALAQGPLSIGGFGAGNGGNSVSVNHLTVGRVPRGAVVQVARQTSLPASYELRLALNEPDFVSAGRVARAINAELATDAAKVADAGAVVVRVPDQYRQSVPDLIARLEPLPVTVDTAARVVINERTGTVVMGSDVRVGSAAVAHGNLSVRIRTRFDVSQPAPMSGGDTTVVPRTDVDVDEGNNQLVALEAGATLADVVKALNVLGASPRDIIAIMQALKAAGALRAELVVL